MVKMPKDRGSGGRAEVVLPGLAGRLGAAVDVTTDADGRGLAAAPLQPVAQAFLYVNTHAPHVRYKAAALVV